MLTGFQRTRQDTSSSPSARSSAIDFALKVGGLAETWTWWARRPSSTSRAAPPTTSCRRTCSSTCPSARATPRQPAELRARHQQTAPPTAATPAPATALLIDGVDTRDPSGGTAWTFYNYNIVEEVQFQGIGAPAEYGAFTGAIVNTITKSGGNRFAGLFDVHLHEEQPRPATTSRPSTSSQNPNLAESGEDEQAARLHRPSSAARSSRTSCSSSPAPSATSSDDGPDRAAHAPQRGQPRFNGKLTWQPSANDNVTGAPAVRRLQHHRPRRLQRAAPTPTTSPTARTRRSTCGSTQWRHLFGSKTFTEVKYTGWWGFYDLNPEVNDCPYHFDENGADTVSQGWPTTPTADATR